MFRGSETRSSGWAVGAWPKPRHIFCAGALDAAAGDIPLWAQDDGASHAPAAVPPEDVPEFRSLCPGQPVCSDHPAPAGLTHPQGCE